MVWYVYGYGKDEGREGKGEEGRDGGLDMTCNCTIRYMIRLRRRTRVLG